MLLEATYGGGPQAKCFVGIEILILMMQIPTTSFSYLGACSVVIPGLGLAASYVQRRGFCNNHPVNICMSVKRVKMIERS